MGPAESAGEKGMSAPTPTCEKKAAFTYDEFDTCEELLKRVARQLGMASLAWSTFDRALWSLACRVLPEAIENVKAPRLERPSSRDLEGIERFQERLEDYLLSLWKAGLAREEAEDRPADEGGDGDDRPEG